MTFGRRLRILRHAAGLTSTELGERAGFVVQPRAREGGGVQCCRVIRLEGGKTVSVTPDELVRLAQALNTDPNTLCGWMSPPRPEPWVLVNNTGTS